MQFSALCKQYLKEISAIENREIPGGKELISYTFLVKF